MNHRHPLPLFLREAQHLQRLGAWRLCGQALLTGLIAGGIIGLFRRLYDTFRLYASYWLQLYAADTPWAWAYILGGLALLAMIAHLLLRQEPLISGSGIPQVELMAAGLLPPMRWRRVLWRSLPKRRISRFGRLLRLWNRRNGRPGCRWCRNGIC